ncbi:flagellar motor switch protein FliN [Paenalcaligenes sp. Me131]|uniref:flagellar motor switch protein FliN n=1 Tax=Paenalcaligenes sp. Me131 TaxID=3392636 RepID=UPI003D27089F
MTEPQNNNPTQPVSSDDNTELDWDAAMAEQLAGQNDDKSSSTQAAGLENLNDDWASALAEQTAATSTSPEPDSGAPNAIFPPLSGAGGSSHSDIDMIMDIPVQLSVELGRTRLTIKNILQLGQGSVVELDGLAGEPMDIFVNGYLIAQGEVVVVDEKYGIRVTDIITPSDRIQRLNTRR